MGYEKVEQTMPAPYYSNQIYIVFTDGFDAELPLDIFTFADPIGSMFFNFCLTFYSQNFNKIFISEFSLS